MKFLLSSWPPGVELWISIILESFYFYFFSMMYSSGIERLLNAYCGLYGEGGRVLGLVYNIRAVKIRGTWVYRMSSFVIGYWAFDRGSTLCMTE